MNTELITFDRQSLKASWSKLARRLHEDNYRFYVTFRTRPVLSRTHLESLIAEFAKRLNRRVLGKNFYKQSFVSRRCDALVFFEQYPDMHAHALFKPPISTYEKSDDQLIDLIHLVWTGKSKSKNSHSLRQRYSNKTRAINFDGDIDVRVLPSPNDAYRVTDYSLKQASFGLDQDKHFKFLSEFENDGFSTLKPDYGLTNRSTLSRRRPCSILP